MSAHRLVHPNVPGGLIETDSDDLADVHKQSGWVEEKAPQKSAPPPASVTSSTADGSKPADTSKE